MNPSIPRSDIFDSILSSAIDITNTFDIDLGDLPNDVLEATQAVTPYIDILRQAMLEHPLSPSEDLSGVRFGLLNMPEWADAFGEDIQAALSTGQVMAVDGTPLIHPQRFLTEQVYAVAVGGLTSRNPMDLKARLVKVKAELEGNPSTLEDVSRVLDSIERSTESQSWPSAFLSYQERYFALKSEAHFLIVDGPLIPQEVLTRRAGVALFQKMLGAGKSKCYVGVIKDLRASDPALRFYARALKTGEFYIVDTLGYMLASRLGTQYRGSVRDFVENIGKDVFRGVFKPGQKAFGFECHRSDLAKVVALLWLDRNNQPGYELPFLLAQVDAQIRGRYRPSETMAAIESTLARHSMDEYFDETDERGLR